MSFMKSLAKVMGLAAVLGLIVFATPAFAAPVVLSDLNSTATIDTSASCSPIGNQCGMTSWTVNGISQLYTQWFFFRTSTTATAQGIDTLPSLFQLASDTNANP